MSWAHNSYEPTYEDGLHDAKNDMQNTVDNLLEALEEMIEAYQCLEAFDEHADGVLGHAKETVAAARGRKSADQEVRELGYNTKGETK